MANVIDISDFFFVIDSDNLQSVVSRLYGFIVSARGIFDKENQFKISEEDITGCGSYVIVSEKNNVISVRQDANGTYGLYLFKHGGYFALSNSIVLLIEHLKHNHILSLNRDYANGLFINGLSSRFYEETIINEVKLLEREAIVHINTVDRTMKIEREKYSEHSIMVDTKEGLEILDNWYNKWCLVINEISKQTDQISVDLTGGFDSRMVFSIILGAGINIDKIRVFSADDQQYTHGEDYQIAKQIAERFGFCLNKPLNKCEGVNLSFDDALNIPFYSVATIHKEFWPPVYKRIDKLYSIGGQGGEALRGKWNYSKREFIKMECNASKRYSQSISSMIDDSVEKLLLHSFELTEEKNDMIPKDSIEQSIAFYRDTWNRSHFGKITVRLFLCNNFLLNPLMDPELYKLEASNGNCNDLDLLMALIFVRYCPELLDFKFQGNRTIDTNTIEYAKKINWQNPFEKKKIKKGNVFCIATKDASDFKHSISNNKLSSAEINSYIKDVVTSVRGRHLFLQYFSKELYDFAVYDSEIKDYVPLRECYFIFSLIYVLQCIQFSEQAVARTIKKGFDEIRKDYYIESKGMTKQYGFPYELTGRSARIVLYGAGVIGQQYKNQLDRAKSCTIVKWVDINYMKISIEEVESIYSIFDVEYDYIVIAIKNKKDADNVKCMLISMGVQEEKIVH